ncbi:hypothetical protein IJT10_06410 [bacterium]|nr:hypothetical protein [bacterium]
MKNYKVYLALVLLLFLNLSACEKHVEVKKGADVDNCAIKFVKVVWVDKDKVRAASLVTEEAEDALRSMELFCQNSSVKIADIKLLDSQREGKNWIVNVEILNIDLHDNKNYRALIKMFMDKKLKISSLSCSVSKNNKVVVEM